MLYLPKWMVLSAFALVVLLQGGTPAWSQDKKAEGNPAAPEPQGELEHPKTIPVRNLLPLIPTIPTRKQAPAFNVQFVDASLLPRDKQGIWVLDFAFKSLRMRTVEIPGKGRKQTHYLYYRITNHTGKPRELVPQFTLVTDTGKRYEESVLPAAVKIIQVREDASITLLGAVDVAGVIPASTKEGIDDTVFGVAIWEGVDPHADRMSIYVRGLSDGYKEVPAPDGGKPSVKYKTLRIDLIRRGDARNLNEKEIQLKEPPYEWIYW